MKSTKTQNTTKNNHTTKSNCGRGNANNCTTKSNCGKSKKNAQESETDPSGSYTGNPVGWGEYAEPVQDADDL